MQSIQLPDDQFAKLTAQAQASGYENLTAFMQALATEPSQDPRGSLSEAELRQNVAELEAADAEIDAGRGIDAAEAFRRIGEKHGFTIKQ